MVLTKGSDRVELFNLGEDPYEKKDVAVERPEKVGELKRALAEVSGRDKDALAEPGKAAGETVKKKKRKQKEGEE
jgi:hypothetical protein